MQTIVKSVRMFFLIDSDSNTRWMVFFLALVFTGLLLYFQQLGLLK